MFSIGDRVVLDTGTLGTIHGIHESTCWVQADGDKHPWTHDTKNLKKYEPKFTMEFSNMEWRDIASALYYMIDELNGRTCRQSEIDCIERMRKTVSEIEKKL